LSRLYAGLKMLKTRIIIVIFSHHISSDPCTELGVRI